MSHLFAGIKNARRTSRSDLRMLGGTGGVASGSRRGSGPRGIGRGPALLGAQVAELDRFRANSRRLCGLCGGRMVRQVQSARLPRSEEHTSELQSLMRISYAVFCLNKKKQQ